MPHMKRCARSGCRTLVPIGTTYCPRHQRQYEEARARDALARRKAEDETRRERQRLYKSAAWRKLRLVILDRDGWACQWPGCGVSLVPGAAGARAAVVDHKEPHRGDLQLFFDPNNLQALCKPCHDRRKQRAERRAERETD